MDFKEWIFLILYIVATTLWNSLFCCKDKDGSQSALKLVQLIAISMHVANAHLAWHHNM